MIKSKKEAETLRELTEKHPDFTFNLYYDVWERPGSYSKRQEAVKSISAKELSEKYGDFEFEGWYTLSRNPDIADVWAAATGDKRYDHPDTKEKEGETNMNSNIDWNKSYEDCEIDTFELENEVDAICRQMQQEGVNPELIEKVSELGCNATQTLLEYQTLDAAVVEVCDGRELGNIGEYRHRLERDYKTRMLTDEAAERIESYVPGLLEECPDAVILESGDIENYFKHGRTMWCIDRDGSAWFPKEASDAIAFIKEGGLVLTSAFMVEQELTDVIRGHGIEERD